jgi:hypothetical protein
MKNIEILKCMTLDEMVKIVSDLSDMNAALDIINNEKHNINNSLEWQGNKLVLNKNK